MKAQLVSLLIMFIILFLLAPFPEIDSLRRTFTTGSADIPVSAVQPAIALEQSIPSIDLQEDTEPADEPVIYICASDAEPERSGVTPVRSSIIREAAFEQYQMEKNSAGIRENQVSRSSEHYFTPKSSFYATSIHSNTVPTRQNFDFNDILQKRCHVEQRNNSKQFLFIQQVPNTVLENWLLPQNGPNTTPGEQPLRQQLDNGTIRETDQIFTRDLHRRSVPSDRPARRTASSLSSGVSNSRS